MTTQIQTTAAMRRFNQALEDADSIAVSEYPFEMGLEQLYTWLQGNECERIALTLKHTAKAVGYFKEENL